MRVHTVQSKQKSRFHITSYHYQYIILSSPAIIKRREPLGESVDRSPDEPTIAIPAGDRMQVVLS